MGKISDRLSDIARNAGDLTPLREPVRNALKDGNRADRLAGLDWEGRPFKDLAPSTLERRRKQGLNGPPLAAHGPTARIITKFFVDVRAGVGRLTFTGSWPMDWVRFHVTGSRRLPRRDPMGFRAPTLDRARALLLEHIANNKKGWWFRGR